MKKFWKKNTMNKEADTNDLNTEETIDQQEAQQEESVVDENETAQETEAIEEDPLTLAQQEAGEWKDKYMRLHAEFDNFRKRTQRERVELLKNASADVLKNILPTLDDFDRAIQANATNEDIEAVKEGFAIIANKMNNTLKNQGLEPMDAQGKVFDTDHHEAITKIPAPTEELKGKVVDVVERGYFLNEKVLRYAKVVIGE